MRVVTGLSYALIAGLIPMAQPAGLPSGVANTQDPKNVPLSPREALQIITVPDGFEVTLFAGEPDVYQPVAFTFDDRGRLWVVECFSYPEWKTRRDRVVIFTDQDQDGRFDERRIFWDEGHRLFGLEYGFGGLWLAAAPHLLFLPDRDGDDRPDGPPEVVLDGFTLDAGHNSVNGLAWGPDGWLYGRHGITAPSRVGRPGQAEGERVALNCGIWRYHPTRRLFEVVAHGTTNPWGLDWDDHGQAFFSNNVIGHLWHLVPGAHYERMHGLDYHPHVYDLMESCSDHLHWKADRWQFSGGGRPEQLVWGGGHSHAGGMVYLGDNWPDEYRGRFFMNNIHGNRMLYDVPAREGAGYRARHGDAFLIANDKWFRGIHLGYGPDGGVYVSDWHDLGECHDRDGSHRTSGRIYKITYGKPAPLPPFNLAELDEDALIALQLHRNDWQVRHARRLLQERAASGGLTRAGRDRLWRMFREERDVTRQLRALWALYVCGEIKAAALEELLGHENEHVRWWAVQWLVQASEVTGEMGGSLRALAQRENSLFVRMSLASALRRLDPAQRRGISLELLAQGDNAQDDNLVRMIWYAVEPCVASDRDWAVRALRRCRLPAVREWITRRLAEGR